MKKIAILHNRKVIRISMSEIMEKTNQASELQVRRVLKRLERENFLKLLK